MSLLQTIGIGDQVLVNKLGQYGEVTRVNKPNEEFEISVEGRRAETFQFNQISLTAKAAPATAIPPTTPSAPRALVDVHGRKITDVEILPDRDFVNATLEDGSRVSTRIAQSPVVTAVFEKKTVLDWALWAAACGWYVVKVNRDKTPATPHGFKDATRDLDAIRKWWDGDPNRYNYLIDLGRSNLVVYDYDSVAPDPTKPATFRIKTGRNHKEGTDGGYHDYYIGSCKTRSIFVPPVEPITEKDTTDKKGKTHTVRYDALNRIVGKHGVTVGEIRSRGAYTIGPGSIHATGRRYEIVQDVPLYKSPEQNAESVREDVLLVDAHKLNGIADVVEQALDEASLDRKRREVYENVFKILTDCPWEYEHTGGKGLADGGSSSAVLVMPSGALVYSCRHAHCEGRGWSDLRAWLEETLGRKISFSPATVGTPAASPGTVSASNEQMFQWGEVQPLDSVLAPVLPLCLDYLPISIRPYCKDIAERMSVPLDFAAIAALQVLAGVIGRRAFVFPKAYDKDWRESVVLSSAIIADSGDTKTPTWKAFINPAIEQEADWRREHQDMMVEYAKAHAKWKESVKALKNKKIEIDKKEEWKLEQPTVEEIKSGKAGKLVKETDLQPPQLPPNYRRLVFNDATPEKIHAAMEENPAGLLFYRDELTSWVSELDKDGRETQRGMFLAAMNGDDDYAIDRIMRGSVYAKMCLGVCGCFQPELLRAFLADTRNTDDGTVQRFMMLVWPDKLKNKKLLDRAVDESAKLIYRRLIRAFAPLQAESVWIHFDEEAQALFNIWFDKLSIKIDEESDPATRSHLSKYKGGLPKVAALFQLIDLAAGGATLAGNYMIDKKHLEMAIGFTSEYLESHMRRVYGSGYTPEQLVEAGVTKRIEDGAMPDGMSVRDLQHSCWKGLKGQNADTVAFALETLASKNWVRPVVVQPAGAGRPTERWMINPAARKHK